MPKWLRLVMAIGGMVFGLLETISDAIEIKEILNEDEELDTDETTEEELPNT